MDDFKITTFGSVLRKRMDASRQKPDITVPQNAVNDSAPITEPKADVQPAPSKQKTSKTINVKSNTKKLHGVYIQDINGNFWKSKDWDGSVEPNAIALINENCRLMIALDGNDMMPINDCNRIAFEEVLTPYYDRGDAMLDYDGAHNTKMLLTMQCNNHDSAVGYCNSYVFPDGVTHGYLPSLGELHTAFLNRLEIGTALNACGGRQFAKKFHWSSTLRGKSFDCELRSLWVMNWSDDYADWLTPSCQVAVRPFAPF